MESVPGLAKDFNTFCTLEGALKLRKLVNSFEGGRLVISTVTVPISCPGAPGKFAIILDDYLKYVRGRSDFEISFLWPIGNIGPPAYNANIAEEGCYRAIYYLFSYPFDNPHFFVSYLITVESLNPPFNFFECGLPRPPEYV